MGLGALGRMKKFFMQSKRPVNTHAEKIFEQKPLRQAQGRHAKIAKGFGLRFAEYATLHSVLQYSPRHTA